jgi:hypothetical protein
MVPKWMCDPHRLLRQRIAWSTPLARNYQFEESLIRLLGSTLRICVDPGNYGRLGDQRRNNIHTTNGVSKRLH